MYDIYLIDLEGNKIDIPVEAFGITERAHEELDSGTVFIPATIRKLPFDRYSKVFLHIDGIKYGMLLWGNEIEVVVKGTVPYYSFKLAIIEPTKWLEKIRMPYITFFQPIQGTKYTMKDVVQRLLNVANIMPEGELFAKTRPATLSFHAIQILSQIEAPQFSIEPGNLREQLISVLLFVNGIPRLNIAGILDVTFFNEREGQITPKGVISRKIEVDAEEYATTLETTIANLSGDKDEKTSEVQVMSRKDVVGVRSADPIVGDENFRIELPFNIETIKKLEVYTGIFANPFVNPFSAIYLSEYIDITDYVFELERYNAIRGTGSPFTQRKTHAIWFKRGTRFVEGLATTWGAFNVQQSIFNIIHEVLLDYEWEEDPELIFNLQPNFKWRDLMFRVTYIPAIGARLHQEREDNTDVKVYSVMQANIRSSVADITSLLNNMKGVIQRVGLPDIMESTVYTDLKDSYPLTAFDDVNVITDKEIIGFPDFKVVRYGFTPRFNRLSQFVNIDRRFRPLQVMQNDQVFERLEVFREHILASDQDLGSKPSSILDMSHFMKVFEVFDTNYSINIAYIEIDGGSTIKILMPIASLGGQNVMLFSLRFNSPNLAGNAMVVNENFIPGVDRREMFPVFYTKPNGMFDTIRVRLYNHFYEAETGVEDFMGRESFFRDYLENVADRFPGIDPTHGHEQAKSPILFDTKNLMYYKDTNEIANLDMMIQVSAYRDNVDDIIIGANLTIMNPLVYNYDGDKGELYVWVTEDKYEAIDTKFAKGEIDESYSFSVSGKKLTVDAVPQHLNWAIADYNGNLYLAVNQINKIYNEIYFNNMTLREDLTYNPLDIPIELAESYIEVESGLEVTMTVYPPTQIRASTEADLEVTLTIYPPIQTHINAEAQLELSITHAPLILNYVEVNLQAETSMEVSIEALQVMNYDTDTTVQVASSMQLSITSNLN